MNLSNIYGIYCANPHYYDYIHSINLKEDGSFIFMTGAGQCSGTDIVGQWHINNTSDNIRSIKFMSITEVNPFDNDEVIQKHDDYEVEFKIVEKEVSFRCEVVWHVYNEEDWPAIIYPFSLHFSEDPITAIKGQDDNLYYKLESKDFGESQNTFYPTKDKVDTNFHDLKTKNIEIIDIYKGQDVLSKKPKKPWWRFWL